MNFAKVLKTPFLRNTSERLLLENAINTVNVNCEMLKYVSDRLHDKHVRPPIGTRFN